MKIKERLKDLIYFKVKDAHEFEPVLAEIEDSPMNPLGPVIFWIIISFIFIASLWMYFGKVDVVITAQGVVIPAGEEKLVQSLDKGVVTQLNVKEGDYVTKGEVVAIVAPAEYEPGMELTNLYQEEKSQQELLSADRQSLSVAMAEKRRLDNVRDLIVQSRYDEIINQVNTLTHEINRINAQLVSTQNRIKQLEKQKQILTSPIDGYVGQIFVHTIGGVVTPAEKIMSVVPKDAKLIIKAFVLNKDIGFVKTDMPVSIKIDTFNFQKYGMLEGVVNVVSPNSRQDERLGLVYDTYIVPKQHSLIVEGKKEGLIIGMSTTNEIKIGKRRIIEFFIYPLIKYLDESIKVQ